MISFISRANNLKVLTEPLLHAEVLSFSSCTGFQRTLFTNNILHSRIINKSKIREQVFPSGNESDLGKIIELSENFDEVKVSENDKKEVRNQNKAVNKNNVTTQKSRKDVIDKNSSIFGSIMTQLKSRKTREENQEIILEGKRLIKHAISAGCMPSKIFFTRNVNLEELKLPKGIKMFELPYKNMELWSDLTTSQGIVGVFKMPTFSTSNNSQSLPLTIVCDNVKDPGNLGSILRVIASVGCCKLLLTKGCVHLWEPKVLRAAAGAHFQLPETKYDLLWSDIKKEINENSKVLLADLCSQASEYENTSDMTTFRKSNKISENLPSDCYYSLKYGDENTVIIIGGETHGISDEAYEFTLERKGSKIFIPMNNQIESLNNSVALGILAYEYRRQYDFMCREAQSEGKLRAVNHDSS